jgi:hypothetical protein
MHPQSGTQITVTGSTHASPGELFALLADPRRHPGLDGSGMLRAAVAGRPVRGLGDVFTMEMHLDEVGDYRTENHIVEFEQDRRIAWMTAGPGRPPAGQHWEWRITPNAEDGTALVTHIYDWSRMTDPRTLAIVRPPRVSSDDLRKSVNRLIAAAETKRSY